jgi:hypothetical protein
MAAVREPHQAPRQRGTLRGVETREHRRLKRLAVMHLRGNGAPASAWEVRCPISRWVLDAAGWQDRPGGSESGAPASGGPRTVIIECKQSREDFLRDSRQAEKLLARRAHLQRVRLQIELERIPVEEPELRRGGSSLFPELDDWDYSASKLPAYQKVLRELRRIEEQLYGETKFHFLARYRLADRLYLAAPRGMVKRYELPTGWGLLECPPQWLDGESHRERLDEPPSFDVVVESAEHASRPEHRLRLLRNIAVKACAAAMRRRRH